MKGLLRRICQVSPSMASNTWTSHVLLMGRPAISTPGYHYPRQEYFGSIVNLDNL
jgi:hypothetical protein